MKLFKKKKCKHDFSNPWDGTPTDGGECQKCGKTWIEILEENKNI